MKLTGAMMAYGLWFVVMGAAFVVASLHAVKQGGRGIGWGLLTILGALMTFAFVSAVTGLYEMAWYYLKPAFSVSLGVGVLGAGLFGAGCSKLRMSKTP